MKRAVIIGANGQLGADLVRTGLGRNFDLTCLTHAEIEITDMSSVEAALSVLEPEVVLNTAACHGANQYTTADQETFFRVNGIGPMNLARFCRRHDAILVHFSTDYVFGREQTSGRALTEEDPPCPVNVYGASKLGGEHLVRAFCPKHYLVRIASVYGRTGCRAKGNSNFVKMVLGKVRQNQNLKVVTDQVMSPTWTRSIAAKTFELIEGGASFGLYHMAGSGYCSWYDFACEIVRIAGGAVEVEQTTTPREGLEDVFIRPRWTALDNLKLRQEGFRDLLHWREDLEEYIRTEEAE